MRKKKIPEPSRVRRTPRSFGWLDHRLLREGWLETMTLQDIAVYVFLVLAADRDGVSYYRKEKIAKALDLDFGQVAEAIRRLRERELIAFQPFSTHNPNGFYQVLDVPEASGSGAAGNAVPECLGGLLQTMLRRP